MLAWDMCLLRVEQVEKRSMVSWKHTSTEHAEADAKSGTFVGFK
jgi:hypothetical protein